MKSIELTGGKLATVDDADFDELSRYTWVTDRSGYAYRFAKVGMTRRKLRMHRHVLGLTDPAIFCDHADGDKLNNQRSNIRICTKGQNNANKGRQRNNTSGFKGVCWSPKLGKWYSYIRSSGGRKFLGTYATPQEAHEVYCLAADMVFGEFANHGGR